MSTKLKLKPIRKWQGITCAPTALSAVTGKSRDEIQQTIRIISGNPHWTVSDKSGTAPKHWAGALVQWGFELDIRTINPISNFFRSYRKFLNDWHLDELVLVAAFDDAIPVSNGHVFAMQGGKFIDFYTSGKVKEIDKSEVHPGLKAFRVKYLIAVRRK
jgi:hypothetical protein